MAKAVPLQNSVQCKFFRCLYTLIRISFQPDGRYSRAGALLFRRGFIGDCRQRQQRGSMLAGLALVMFAAVFQGVFLLPASRMRNWAWEHWWMGFSLFGMLLGNWALG